MDLEQIAELIVRGSTEGMDKVKSDLDAVAQSQDNLNQKSLEGATVTETVQKRQVSAAQAYDRVRNRIDDTFRSTNAFAKAQKTLDDAVAQGVMPRSQYLADLELLAARYSKSDQTQELFQRGQKALAADLAAGKIGSEQYQAALGSLSQRLGQTRAATAGLSFEAKNLSFQLVDVGQGLLSGQPAFMIFAQQAGQIGQIIGTSEKGLSGLFGELGSAITGFLTPMRLLGGGILGAGAAVGMAAMDWRDGEKDISRALLGIGKASGATADDMIHFSAKAALATNESFATARGVMTELVSSSGVARDRLAAFGTDTLQFAKAMNIGSDEAAKFMAAALIDPVKGAEQINSKIQFLDNSTRHYIKTMADAGDLEGARALVIDKMTPAIEKAGKATDGWGFSWGRFKANISDIGSSVGSIFGSGTDQDQRAALVAKRDLLTSNPSTAGSPIVQAGVSRLTDQIDKLENKIKSADEASKGARFTELATAADGLVTAFVPAISKIETLQGAIKKLDEASNNSDLSGRQTYANDNDRALVAARTQLTLTIEQADASDRHNHAVAEIAMSYKGVSTQTALALDLQKQQLTVARAVTGQEKLAAQEALERYQLMRDEGKTPTDAAQIAAGNRANAEAQIRGQLQGQLLVMQDQLVIAQAVTGQQQLAAQADATRNQIIRDTGDAMLATQTAATQREIAEARINAQIQNQVDGLDQQRRMINAVASGTGAATAAAIAYENAIRAGASETEAAALKSAVLAANMAKVSAASRQASEAMHFASGGPQEFGNQWGNQTVGLPGTAGTDDQRAMWDRLYGAGGYSTYITGGYGPNGGRFDVNAKPTDAGLQYQYSQTLNNAAMSRMDPVTKAKYQAGSYKLSTTDAQAIADAWIARSNLSTSANAQRAASDFVSKADSSSASTSNSLINPLYTSGSSNIIAFRAATGMDYTVPGTGPTDSVRVSGLVSPGERLIAIPPGGAPPADMRGGSSTSRPAINQRIVIQAASMRGASDTMSQLAARAARAASAVARHR